MLLETLAAGLQATALSHTLRASIWLYPLVNTGHWWASRCCSAASFRSICV